MKITKLETLRCDAGGRNYQFVKVTTQSGVVGWSEFDEGFGSACRGQSKAWRRRSSASR
jgi:L-alanine-DL-glutamate epimerase-like enolase superfamily enzyme